MGLLLAPQEYITCIGISPKRKDKEKKIKSNNILFQVLIKFFKYYDHHISNINVSDLATRSRSI